MEFALSLATACVTLYAMWLIGNKNPAGWAVALGNQVLWLAFVVVFQAWGLLPLNFFLTITYIRNLIRWRKEANDNTRNA